MEASRLVQGAGQDGWMVVDNVVYHMLPGYRLSSCASRMPSHAMVRAAVAQHVHVVAAQTLIPRRVLLLRAACEGIHGKCCTVRRPQKRFFPSVGVEEEDGLGWQGSGLEFCSRGCMHSNADGHTAALGGGALARLRRGVWAVNQETTKIIETLAFDHL